MCSNESGAGNSYDLPLNLCSSISATTNVGSIVIINTFFLASITANDTVNTKAVDMRHYTRFLGSCILLAVSYLTINHVLKTRQSEDSEPIDTFSNGVDIGWYPPSGSWITDLDASITEGIYGFRFGGHDPDISGQYSYCNMEHVHPETYAIPPRDKYELKYVEVVSILCIVSLLKFC